MLLRVVSIGISSNNSTAGIFLAKRREDKTPAARSKILSESTKKLFRDTLDEDVDSTRATKTSARIETHDCWLTGLKNFGRAQRHFIFQTSCAKRANSHSIFANQHACARPAIA